MELKNIRYKEVAENLLEIYRMDERLQEVDTFDDLINFLQENGKDLIYTLEGKECQ